MSKAITCPACGGAGVLPAEREGDRPVITCDMCGGEGWGILDPDAQARHEAAERN